MAYNRVIIEGTLGGGVEKWSCGLNFSSTAGTAVATQSELSTWAEAIRAGFNTANTWSPAMMGLLGSNGTVDRVRTYFYPFTVGPAAAAGISSGISVTGTNTISFPPQCSLVISLLTGVPGRKTRGRTFWPCLTGTMSATLKRSGNPTQAVVSTSFANMLRAIADIPAASNLEPVIVSTVGGGTVTTVTSVSVGDVVDTMRSRRDSLQEIRVSTVVPA